MKSGVGFAARHQGDKHIATAQIATTGLVSLNYAHRLSEKVSKLCIALLSCTLCASVLVADVNCVYSLILTAAAWPSGDTCE